MKIVQILILALVALVNSVTAQNKCSHTLSGKVLEKGSRELLPGVAVYVPSLKQGISTNNYGFYSLSLPCDTVTVIFTYVGFGPKVIKFKMTEDKMMDIEMEGVVNLKEVEINAEQLRKASEETRMSTVEIPVKQIKEIPALLGEKDVLKVLQLMPGVQKGSEGSAGFYVRGGGPDQNLIILDDAPVYNAFHLFGFFSLFNGDALKSVELIKGGFPARYGGRLSSVIEMSMKDGNKEKLHGEGGIGLISSRLTLEGPALKGKASWLVSARRTYIDILAAPLIKSLADGNKAGYFFYDANAKMNYELDEKNRFYLSFYAGRDKFYFEEKGNTYKFSGGLDWGNITSTARWNHIYGPKVFSNTSLIFSNYTFSTNVKEKSNGDEFTLLFKSGIRDISAKYDIHFYPDNRHHIQAGAFLIYHKFIPQAVTIKNTSIDAGSVSEKSLMYAFDPSIYLEDEFKVNSRLRLMAGIRGTGFVPKGGSYIKAEPRVSLSYNIKKDLAVKGSYALMNQYIHLISNTGAGLPTDLWVPSTARVRPQQSQQVAFGAVKDFLSKGFSVTVEGYYKRMDRILGFKEGASFLDTQFGSSQSSAEEVQWEKNVTSGKGKSYGAELLIQKKIGKLSGWIGYTLSWTKLQFDSLNFGKEFYARYDRRHDFSLVLIYHLREETESQNGITLSATWVYGTGNAITLPISTYVITQYNPHNSSIYQGHSDYGGTQVSEYTEKNAFRMAAYHRLDFSLQVTKRMKKHTRTWEFSVYNLYNRMNPYFYYIEPTINNKSVLKQVTLFPLIPSVSYNFRF